MKVGYIYTTKSSLPDVDVYTQNKKKYPNIPNEALIKFEDKEYLINGKRCYIVHYLDHSYYIEKEYIKECEPISEKAYKSFKSHIKEIANTADDILDNCESVKDDELMRTKLTKLDCVNSINCLAKLHLIRNHTII